jgi:hypothetical protein
VLLSYLPATHVPTCVAHVRAGGDATIYANIDVGVGDRDPAADSSRFDLFSYAIVDACANSFSSAGFAKEVAAIRAAHQAGDRRAIASTMSSLTAAKGGVPQPNWFVRRGQALGRSPDMENSALPALSVESGQYRRGPACRPLDRACILRRIDP